MLLGTWVGHLLSGLVVSGLEVHPESYLWIFSQVGTRILGDSGFRMVFPYPKDIQDKLQGYGKKILELLLTVFLT